MMYRGASRRLDDRRTRWSAAALAVAITMAITGVFPVSMRSASPSPGAATSPDAPTGPGAVLAGGDLPVVLVHGLNSTAEAWQEYTRDGGFLAEIGRRGFAVGDGQAPGVMDMGHWTAPTGRTNTIAENAAILAEYIAGVRSVTGAEHVDIVAHSMGGLVARYYVDHLMRSRDVARVIMLGTPNEGSDCASLPAALGIGTPATLELRPAYVREVFNRAVSDRNGVPFFVLAGTKVTDPIRSPCAGVPSDGVVSRVSATTVDAASAQLPLGHIGLPQSRTAFDEFVRPVLTSAFDPNVFAAQPSHGDGSDEQFAAVAAAHVPAGGEAEFVVQLDRVTVAAFALFDPSGSVELEVRGASGAIVELDPGRNGVTLVDDPAALVHLGYGFHNPRPGPWRVTARASAATPEQGADIALGVRTTGGAQLRASTSTLLGQLDAPVEIFAELTAAGQPVDVSEAVAVIRRPDGSLAEVPLTVKAGAAQGRWRPAMAGVHGIDVRLAGVTAGGEPVERVALLAVEIEPAPARVWVARAGALAAVALLIAVATLLVYRYRRRRHHQGRRAT